MHALAVVPQPFFSARGTPFSVYYRTLVMAEQGVSWDLLTYGQGQDVELPNTRIIRTPAFRLFGAVRPGPSMLKLFHDFFLILRTVTLLIRHRYDFVHVHEEAVFFCRFLKPIFRFQLVYDMHSFLPEQLETTEFTKSKLIKMIFTRLQDGSIQKSDAVITICPDLANHVIRHIDDNSTHLLIENSIFDPIRFVENDDAGATAEVEMPKLPEGHPIVIYAGTFERYQGIDLLIEGFAQVVRACPEARLLMVGGRPALVEQARQRVADVGLSQQVILTGPVGPDIARALNKKANVLTSPRSSGSNTPMKLYEQLASGRPLVATRIRSHTQVLSDDIAFLVEPTSDGLAHGVLRALTQPEEATKRAAAARLLYEQNYSRQAYHTKIDRLLKCLA